MSDLPNFMFTKIDPLSHQRDMQTSARNALIIIGAGIVIAFAVFGIISGFFLGALLFTGTLT